MRLFFVLATLFCSICFAVAALAEGDKVREKNPVLDADGNVIGVVDPLMDCTEIPAPDQSGRVVYICTPCDDE